MAGKFLCAPHRALLSQDRNIALMRWEEWMTAGQEAMANVQWVEALRYLGCCYELGEMVLEQGDSLSEDDVDRYMVSGHYLAECFARCGARELRCHYLLAVHYQLLQLVSSYGGRNLRLRGNIEFSLQMLERLYVDEGRFGDLQRCREESQRKLAQACH
jgi:hypothetical protein